MKGKQKGMKKVIPRQTVMMSLEENKRK